MPKPVTEMTHEELLEELDTGYRNYLASCSTSDIIDEYVSHMRSAPHIPWTELEIDELRDEVRGFRGEEEA